MNDLNLHYRQLLGLGDDWNVENVDPDLVASRVVIELSHRNGRLVCPECETECSRADTAPKRTWRHLDTMQFATEIRAAVSRCRCEKCGVKTIASILSTRVHTLPSANREVPIDICIERPILFTSFA